MKFIFYNLFIILGTLTSCTLVPTYTDPIPIHDQFTINSKKVGETRIINVWTPPDYKTNTDALPVMYMADGGIKDEDFPHIANTLAELVKTKKIPPTILVGIANTQRRKDLTGPTEIEKDKEIAPLVGGSEKFSAFIKEELFPEINKRYRTTNEKSIIGESLSGLFVVEVFLLTPEMFDNYIAFDPSLWWNDQYLVKTAKEHFEKLSASEKRLWFAGSADMSETVGKLSDILKVEDLPNLKWKYSPEPKEKHSTIFRGTKEKAIIWTLNKSK
ncbi:alpha/beta hydrolase [Chryseobacterium sp. MP_3.2]|uniref:alpha/beta hydrolase n=1 Tax=Chryseobacterium sp. MP_3.2 TaxID=3071712 RepID=UPI002DFCBB0B|nr:putative alpha/beta superfamily hydrolase [Chryseobacterium sp. MP_3.2]